MSQYKWMWTRFGDYTGERFVTREAAIADADETLDPGDTFNTARTTDLDLATLMPCARAITERMDDLACDYFGDASGDWGTSICTKADEDKASEELTAGLHRVIKAWLENHGLMPQFCHMEDEEGHTAVERDGEG